MKKSQNTFGKQLSKLILGLIITLSLSSVAIAVDPPAPDTSTGGTSGKTVTIPPIIPVTGKVYIPVNSSGEANKTYLQNRLLPSIASVIIAITGGLSLLFAIVSGIQMLTAYGNADQATAARKTLIFALVGLVISSLSYGIVAIIASITV